MIEFQATRLLGRHVGRSAEDLAVVRQARRERLRFAGVGCRGGARAPPDEFREAEIEELYAPIGSDHDVAGLEIPVNHPCGGCVLQSRGDSFRPDSQGFGDRHRGSRDAGPQRAPVDILHGDVVRPRGRRRNAGNGGDLVRCIDAAHFIDGADGRMAQGSGGTGLAIESGEKIPRAANSAGRNLRAT